VGGRVADDFPNNGVGDLVRTDRGWASSATCCPTATHPATEMFGQLVWGPCNERANGLRPRLRRMRYAPKPGQHCRRNRGVLSP